MVKKYIAIQAVFEDAMGTFDKHFICGTTPPNFVSLFAINTSNNQYFYFDETLIRMVQTLDKIADYNGIIDCKAREH